LPPNKFNTIVNILISRLQCKIISPNSVTSWLFEWKPSITNFEYSISSKSTSPKLNSWTQDSADKKPRALPTRTSQIVRIHQASLTHKCISHLKYKHLSQLYYYAIYEKETLILHFTRLLIGLFHLVSLVLRCRVTPAGLACCATHRSLIKTSASEKTKFRWSIILFQIREIYPSTNEKKPHK
jgi:hypothetical protein